METIFEKTNKLDTDLAYKFTKGTQIKFVRTLIREDIFQISFYIYNKYAVSSFTPFGQYHTEIGFVEYDSKLNILRSYSDVEGIHSEYGVFDKFRKEFENLKNQI